MTLLAETGLDDVIIVGGDTISGRDVTDDAADLGREVKADEADWGRDRESAGVMREDGGGCRSGDIIEGAAVFGLALAPGGGTGPRGLAAMMDGGGRGICLTGKAGISGLAILRLSNTVV